MKKQCPNPQCKSEEFSKNGFYQRRSDSRIIQRFKCRSCSKRFSNATFSLELHQNKRHLNHSVFKLLGSGVSMRRIALILNIDKKTVQRKFDFLAIKARDKQEELLYKMNNKVEHMQFDDLITIEHTKLKPVSVSIAVDATTRVILGAQTSRIPAFGHLAKISRKKYGRRKSEHKQGLDQLFKKIHPCIKSNAKLRSDEHKFYPEFVATYLKDCKHERFKGGRACVVGQGELKRLARDPLFAINHACAMFRDNIKRLARKSWCTTKKVEALQKHLDIYLWFHNEKLLTG